MRYSGRFTAAEVNSTFHRPHRRTTYERWAATVPNDFRFAVKIPKAISHELRLVETEPQLADFLDDVSSLGAKLGPLLIQLPPSFAFDAGVARDFFRQLRSRHEGACACEPRHLSWFCEDANGMMLDYQIARVFADPVRVAQATEPGGWPGLVYVRLHGSPRVYYSSYSAEYLQGLAERLAASAVETWCILDNTASGAACANALELLALNDKA